ncbi:MerR family transcriptional regulator [Paenibacillus sp. FSL R7-0331]|uniref:MerR family transcriptional regulator n=1 Tax=Paenibacillus sp. FSL R7-0331 TaxID=1536773 RepID=UPI000AA247F3|nr:MerR family transcriptional regulator [Paenibacillus sp. FSL R7-0331]
MIDLNEAAEGEQEGYSIKKTAELTGITEDTIRYYEKIGLLPRARRKGNTHRIYSSADVERMKLIACLKKTGMPLDDMRPYLSLTPDSALIAYPELHDKIQTHKQNILDQIASLQQIVDFIDNKVIQSGIGTRNEACTLTGDTKRMPARK